MPADAPPSDLAKIDALDPDLLAKARADAARLVGGMPRDHAPEEEPAMTYCAEAAQ